MTNSPIILYILGSALWVQREGLYGNRGWFLGRLGGGGRVFKEGSWDDGVEVDVSASHVIRSCDCGNFYISI